MAVTTSREPQTLLEAVNEMLRSVGIAEVTTLDTASLDSEIQSALNALSNTSAMVQVKGWDFNTDFGYPLTPSSIDGSIALPDTALSVVVSEKSRMRYPVERQRKLWDKQNYTFNWTTTATIYPANSQALTDGNLYVDIIWCFAWEDCPQAIRKHILFKAAREWAVGRVPNMETYQFSKALADEAESDAIQYDQESQNRSPGGSPAIRTQQRR